jgi:peptidoglycan/LPS O-acetylase OafA/YrhL
MVILQHLYSGRSIGFLDILWRYQMGNMGVRIFFVISGYLITTLLLKEFAKTQSISLKEFYIRRTFRIFPAYYVFLLAMLIATSIGWLVLSKQDFLVAGFYLTNYIATPYIIGHSWSLCVEEQFYLLWPMLIVFLGWRKATWIAVLFCLCSPMFRAYYLTTADPSLTFWTRFEHAADAIVMGCLYAIYLHHNPKAATIQPKLLGAIGLVASLALIPLMLLHNHPLVWATAGILTANCMIVLILHCAIHAPFSGQHRLLNTPLMCYIGKLSYSLYLWQQVFINGGAKFTAPSNILLVIVCAVASYYLIEKPLLSFRQRFV